MSNYFYAGAKRYGRTLEVIEKAVAEAVERERLECAQVASQVANDLRNVNRQNATNALLKQFGIEIATSISTKILERGNVPNE